MIKFIQITQILILLHLLVGIGYAKPDHLRRVNRISHSQLANKLKMVPYHIRQAIEPKYRDKYFYSVPLQNRPILYYKGAQSYSKVSFKKVKIDSHASQSNLNCWYVFLSGDTDCKLKISDVKLDKSIYDTDLLQMARIWTQEHGLKHTRDLLYREFGNLDQSNGLLEKRLKRTTQDKNYVYSDALAKLAQPEREKIGVLFLLGIGGDDSKNADLIKLSAQKVKQMGFGSRLLQASGTLGSANNASELRDQVLRAAQNFEKVIVVAASKGVSDFVHYYMNYADDLTSEQRARIKLMISLSGVVRDSAIAKWMVESKKVRARLFRGMLTVMGKREMLKGLESLTVDEWEGHDPLQISQKYPNMTWISMPMLPEGADGYTDKDKIANFIRENVYLEAENISPSDGLVETAGSVLPPGTGLEQWVVRAFGPHGLALGRFDDGSALAPLNVIDKYKANPEAGPEILDAFFRALPQLLLK